MILCDGSHICLQCIPVHTLSSGWQMFVLESSGVGDHDNDHV